MIDEKRIADFFAELVSIDSPSLEECEMADTLKAKFAEIGVNFTEDHTQEQTGSNAGNLFARIPGSIDGAPVPPTWQDHNLFWPMSPIGCGCPFTMVSHVWLFHYSSSSPPFFLHR